MVAQFDRPTVVLPSSTVVVNPTNVMVVLDNFVTGVTAGGVGDNGQTLCSGQPCPCSPVLNGNNDNDNQIGFFTEYPRLSLSSYTPTATTPTVGQLGFTFATPLFPVNGFPFDINIFCEITDSVGDKVGVNIKLHLNGLSWSPSSGSVVSCVEDTVCTVAPFFTDLNDNNGGLTKLSSNWYSVRSDDVRWDAAFFKTFPTLTNQPAVGCTACQSDMVIETQKNRNTLINGIDVPVVFNVSITDEFGNSAVVREFRLSVAAVNDAPYAEFIPQFRDASSSDSGLLKAVYDTTKGFYYYENFLQNVTTAYNATEVNGVSDAADEAAQTIVTPQVCISNYSALFVGDVVFTVHAAPVNGVSSSLRFSVVPGLRGYPNYEDFASFEAIRVLLECNLVDSGGAVLKMTIFFELFPPNSPPSVVCTGGCAQTTAEVPFLYLQNFFQIAPSTPAGIADEAEDLVKYVSCSTTSQTCSSSTGSCIEAYAVFDAEGNTTTASSAFSLNVTFVEFAVGRTDFLCTFQDSPNTTAAEALYSQNSLGVDNVAKLPATATLGASITITEVNQVPTFTQSAALQVVDYYLETNVAKSVSFLTDVRPGGVGSASEDSQTLCGGVPCSCTAVNAAYFAVQPVLVLSSYSPSAAVPATAALAYTITTGLADGSATTVVCTLSDSAGGVVTTQTIEFSLTSGPTWAVSNSVAECWEDASDQPLEAPLVFCRVANFLTGLVDNNGGATLFSSSNCPAPCLPSSEPCPDLGAGNNVLSGGGGASLFSQCWYEMTSTDVRFGDVDFLRVKPYLTDTVASCTASAPCASDLIFQVGNNKNTAGATDIPFTFKVSDAEGKYVSSKQVYIRVAAVNDKPTFNVASTGASIVSASGMQSLAYLFDVRTAPIGADDEDGQEVTVSCGSPSGIFAAQPVGVLMNDQATYQNAANFPLNKNPSLVFLNFTLSSTLTTFPQNTVITCVLQDSLGATSDAISGFSLTVTAGPPTWVPSTYIVQCDEDNSAIPANVSSVCQVPGFVGALTDNRGGSAVFNTLCTSNADCFYVFSSTDPRWNVENFVDFPTLSNPTPLPCTDCTADLSFRMKNNFNTGGVDIQFTVSIKEGSGLEAAVETFALEISAINDLPLASGGADINVDFAVTRFTFASFFYDLQGGPSDAADEQFETVSKGSCAQQGGTDDFTELTLTIVGTNANLEFVLSSSGTFPKVCNIACELEDENGGTLVKEFTITIGDGPPSWAAGLTEFTVFEDNSLAPALSAGASLYPKFLEILSFPENFDPQAFYDVTVQNETFFAVLPSLSPLDCDLVLKRCSSDLSFTLAANNYGTTSFEVSVKNLQGFVSNKTFPLEVRSVNDFPTAVLTKSTTVSLDYKDASQKLYQNFVQNMSVGGGVYGQEYAQSLSVVCQASDVSLFSSQPSILLSGTGFFKSGTFHFALTGAKEGTATVVCTVSDGVNGLSVTLPAVTVVATSNLPTFSVLPAVECFEDGVASITNRSVVECYFANFMQDINNNDNTSSFLTAGCPSSATCWYEIVSDDPAFVGLFQSDPVLTDFATPQPCFGACTSDLRFTLADNANTRGSPILLSVLIKNSLNKVSASQVFTLTVHNMNDVPTVGYYPAAIPPNAASRLYDLPNFFTNITAGPPDEQARQLFTGSCVGSPASLFVVQPQVNVHKDGIVWNADLGFELNTVAPTEAVLLNCSFQDDGVGETSVATVYLPIISVGTILSWTQQEELNCVEDNSNEPMPRSGNFVDDPSNMNQPPRNSVRKICVFRNFITQLNDHNNGASVFPQDYFTISSSDARFTSNEVVSSYQILGSPQYCKGDCAMTLMLTLLDDRNTGDTGIPLTVTIKDEEGRTFSKDSVLNVAPVNDFPVILTKHTAEVTVNADEIDIKSHSIADRINVGPNTAIDENGQILLESCVCTSEHDFFATAPTVKLTRNNPEPDGTYASGTLLFSLRVGLTPLPNTGPTRTTVSCVIQEMNQPDRLATSFWFTVTLVEDTNPLCAPYVYSNGVTAGDTVSCVDGSSLNEQKDNFCNVQCKNGYEGGSQRVSCPRQASFPPVCTPRQCSNGVSTAGTLATYELCTNKVSGEICEPTCVKGRNRNTEGFVLNCDTSLNFEDTVTVCEENRCIVSLPFPLLGKANDPLACFNGRLLTTSSDTYCEAMCADGYTLLSAAASKVQCSPEADDMSIADASLITCLPTCSLYTTCALGGGLYKADYESIMCDEQAGCDFDTCCNQLCKASTCEVTRGFIKKIGNDEFNCGQSTCALDQCCDLSCAISNFTHCSGKGYIPRLPAETIRCAPHGCDIEGCCLATCDNDNFAACEHDFYTRKTTPEAYSCEGPIPSRDCKIATCCDMTCRHPDVTCPTTYLKKDDAEFISCGGPGAMCSTELCCDATCATSGGVTCDAAGTPPALLHPNASSVHCPSSSASSCTAALCCETVCATTCAAVNNCHSAGTCSVTTDRCTNPLRANGVQCEITHTSLPTQGECQNGNCLLPVSCEGTPCEVTACTTAVCIGATCRRVKLPDGTLCSDNDDTSMDDKCTNGVCLGTPKCFNVVCSAPTQCHQRGVCNALTGECVYVAKANDEYCDDRDATTTNDRCVEGRCIGQNRCGGVQCQYRSCHTVARCDERTKVCHYTQEADGVACALHDSTTNATSVLQKQYGRCYSGQCMETACDCAPCSQCQTARCDSNSSCVLADLPDASPCLISGRDVGSCFSGFCIPRSLCETTTCTPNLPAGADASCFAPAVCSNATGVCEDATALQDGTACDDGDDTTIFDACVWGVCRGQAQCSITVCPQPSQCRVYHCNEQNGGSCDSINSPNFMSCNDQNTETTEDYCLNGVCVGKTPCGTLGESCVSSAGACHVSKCQQEVCVEEHRPDGDACMKNLEAGLCSCGVCVVSPSSCQTSCIAPTQCHTSTCYNGVCVQGTKLDLEGCDDGNEFTTNDVCMGGVCAGTATCECPESVCHSAGSCNPFENTCAVSSQQENAACTQTQGGPGICKSGQCTALLECATGVTCNPSPCHTAYCNGTTCVEVCMPEGTACDDGNHETTNDVCVTRNSLTYAAFYKTSFLKNRQLSPVFTTGNERICQGFSLCSGVSCAPASQCHAAGRCNVLTGLCSVVVKPDGSICEDADETTKNDVCTNGICAGVRKCAVSVLPASLALSCVCNGQCDEYTGAFTTRALPDGTACDDQYSNTVNDTCADGVCRGVASCGTATCTTERECYTPTCTNGQCAETKVQDGTPCTLLDTAFTVQPTCQNGQCKTLFESEVCVNTNCETPFSVCHLPGRCEVKDSTPYCTRPMKPDYTVCDDGDVLTDGDQCIFGTCSGRAKCANKNCPAPSQCEQSVLCNDVTGACDVTTKSNDVACDDHNPFTFLDTCRDGVCLGRTECPKAGNFSEYCQPSSQCHTIVCPVHDHLNCTEAVTPDVPCNDQNATTLNDVCLPSGACEGTPICDVLLCGLDSFSGEDDVGCINTTQCNPYTQACEKTFKADGSPCDKTVNTNLIPHYGQCRGGICVANATLLCEAKRCDTVVVPSSCHAPATCDPATGECVFSIKTNGAQCDDSSDLTTNDVCDNGICVGTDACLGVTCQSISPCHTSPACLRGECSSQLKPNFSPCENKGDGFYCHDGVCLERPYACQNKPACVASDQCHAPGVCTNETGICTDPVLPDNTVCDDGLAETSGDVCVGGFCKGSVLCNGVRCEAQTQCQAPFCSSTICSFVALNGASCNDGNLMTTNDTCTAGECIGQLRCTNKVCPTADPCSTPATCNVYTGECETTLLPDGTPCDDRNADSINDICTAGTCLGETPCTKPCPPPSQCYTNAPCSPLTGTCEAIKKQDTFACDDMNADTTGDACVSGVCVGHIYCTPDDLAAQRPCFTINSCKVPVCKDTGCTLINKADNTVCDDQSDQTQNDRCQQGECKGEAACSQICTPISQCHLPGTCGSGQNAKCSTPFQPDGTQCDDLDPTTHLDKCISGLCAGTSKCTALCTASDQCHAVGECDSNTGLCSDPNLPDGTSCSDGSDLTTDDSCIAGVCVGTLACQQGSQTTGSICFTTNPCELPQCRNNGAQCITEPKPNGAFCNDLNTTTTGDVCVDGTCIGTPLCTADTCTEMNTKLAAESSCFTGVCDPKTGACELQALPEHSLCDDNNADTYLDTCREGICVGQNKCANVTCTALDMCHVPGVCNYTTGVCTNPVKADSTKCDDGDVSTTNEVCIAGTCQTPLKCGDDVCDITQLSACESYQCTTLSSDCEKVFKSDFTVCDDQNDATKKDHCMGGICVGVNLCADSMDRCLPKNSCHQVGVCVETSGECTDVFKADGTTCDDGNGATYDDMCLNGMCTGTAKCGPQDCSHDLPCHEQGTCDPITGLCHEEVMPEGASCSDNNAATTNDKCSQGTCVGELVCGTSKCVTTNQCQTAICSSGNCLYFPRADGTLCSDNNPATINDRCAGGECVSIDLCQNVTCSASACTTSTCDPKTAKCTATPKPENTLCTDNNTATISDKCVQGVCIGQPKCMDSECAVEKQCVQRGVCNANTGLCESAVKPNETPCNDGDAATANDKCADGVCVGETQCRTTSCRARSQCFFTECDAAFDFCSEKIYPDGTPCDDNDESTVNDFCLAGACSGQDACTGMNCSTTNQCHLDGICKKGQCETRLAPDTTPCNDFVDETTDDQCVSGVCIGKATACNAVPCTPAEPQCHYATCNAATCVELKKKDGVACTLPNFQSFETKCLAGTCVNTDPCRNVICAPPSQCYEAGRCNGAGQCEDVMKKDFERCDDGNAATAGDTCHSGVCYGQNPCDNVVCRPTDACHVAGTCVPTTGLCTEPSAPNGTICDDNNPATSNDVCSSGHCIGSIECSPTSLCIPTSSCIYPSCNQDACELLHAPLNTPCNDNNPHTTADVCTAGVCRGADLCSGVLCDDVVSSCYVSFCEYGSCQLKQKGNNSICDDANPLTVNDRCQDGVCLGQNPCEIGQCGSICEGQPDGTPCDDGRSESVYDSCKNQICVGTFLCTGKVCEPKQCHAGGVCNPSSGTCEYVASPDNTACDDGSPFSLGDKCVAGECTGEVKCDRVCPSATQCTYFSCSDTNECVSKQKFDNTPCDDTNPLTSVDVCLSGNCVGVDLCVANKNNFCTPDECLSISTCDPSSGKCIQTIQPDGTLCAANRGSCTQGVCLLTSLCNGTRCNTTDSCKIPTCVAGLCALEDQVANTPCSDGNPDTVWDTCQEGVCVGRDLCLNVVCNSATQCRANGVCNPQTGLCSEPPLPEGTACNDGVSSTTTDACQAGACVGVATCGDKLCYPSTPDCKVASCEGVFCAERNAPNGTLCNDNNPLTVHDVCQSGACIGTDLCLNKNCQKECNTGACNQQTGICDFTPVTDGTGSCTDFLTSTMGRCVAGRCAPDLYCGTTQCLPSAKTCRVHVCETENCVEKFQFDGTTCNDNNASTVEDRCVGGACVGTDLCANTVCAQDQCQLKACNPQTGLCVVTQQLPNDTPCSDDNTETEPDRCQNGMCVGTLFCNNVQCPQSDDACFAMSCVANVCTKVQKSPGTLCSDGDPASTHDTCSADGKCVGTSKCENVKCTSSSACHDAGFCNPSTGLCTEVPKADGTACLQGVCLAGGCTTIASCTTANDTCLPLTSQCHFASCDGNSVCIRDNLKPDNTPCTDNNPLTFNDKCIAGVCLGEDKCANIICEQRPCKAPGICNAVSGVCEYNNREDGAVCDDMNPDTVDECQAGVCVGVLTCSMTTKCAAFDARCKRPVCVNDNCEEVNKLDFTPCDDNDPFTLDDHCKNGTCVGSAKCSDNQCASTAPYPCTSTGGECNPLTGVCTYPLLADGTDCDGGGKCEAGVCVIRSTCNSGKVVCPVNGQCTTPVCVDTLCVLDNKEDGTPCNNFNKTTADAYCVRGVCTTTERCSSVTCAPSNTLMQCVEPPVCEASSGTCVANNRPEGTPCDDGSATSESDMCSAGNCIGAVPCGGRTCTPLSSCEAVSCVNDECVATPLSDVPCNDNNRATVNDYCHSGVCVGVDLCEGTTCATVDACHTTTCNALTGACEQIPTPFNGPCDDNNINTLNDTCHSGVCYGALQCPDPQQPTFNLSCVTDNPCMLAVCHTTNGCTVQNRPSGSSCNDNDPATSDDTCTDGVCKGTNKCENIKCTILSTCHHLGVCNPLTGECSNPLLSNGTFCDNSRERQCFLGTCVSTRVCSHAPAPLSFCLAADPRCVDSTCELGTCKSSNKADFEVCDDGIAATHNDRCMSGTCVGDYVPCSASQCQQVPRACKIFDTCDSHGACVFTDAADYSPCDDGNQPTTSHCLAGVCISTATCGGNACVSKSQCTTPYCDVLACKYQNKDDGTLCDDGKALTQSDKCIGGVCVGTPRCQNRVCGFLSTCYEQGVCSPLTGQCEYAKKPTGTTCDDLRAETTDDQCREGSCEGLLVCGGTACGFPASQCKQMTCSGSLCIEGDKAAGTICNDNNPSTEGDVCTVGVCRGLFPTCANGTLLDEAKPSQCQQKDNAAEVFCPFGVCGEQSCCKKCAEYTVASCHCGELVLSSELTTCPSTADGGCTTGLCCSPGLTTVVTKFTSNQPASQQNAMSTVIKQSVGDAVGLAPSYITDVAVFDEGSQKSRVEVTISSRPTYAAPTSADFAVTIQQKVVTNLAGLTRNHGFTSALTIPLDVNHNFSTVLVNLTVSGTTGKVQQRIESGELLSAVSQATGVPPSKILGLRAIPADSSDSAQIIELTARPCGLSNDEASSFITTNLGAEMRKGASGALSLLGHPLLATTTNTDFPTVYATLSVEVQFTEDKRTALQAAMLFYVQGVGANLIDFCASNFTASGKEVTRMEGKFADFSGAWSADELSNVLRKAVLKNKFQYAGVTPLNIQAEATTGDCATGTPCGCNQRCIDADATTNNDFKCACRYPYQQGVNQNTPVLQCGASELEALDTTVSTANTTSAYDFATQLKAVISTLANSETLYGDGAWLADVLSLAQKITATHTEKDGKNPEATLVGVADSVSQQQYYLYQRCCSAAALQREEGSCCGDLTDENTVKTTAADVVALLSSVRSTYGVASSPPRGAPEDAFETAPYTVCDSEGCIEDREDNVANRQATAQLARQYFAILHDMNELVCSALSGSPDSSLSSQSSAEFYIAAAILQNSNNALAAANANSFSITQDFSLVFTAETFASGTLCRSLVASLTHSRLEGDGTPHLQPEGPVAGIRYSRDRSQTGFSLAYTFDVTMRKKVSNGDYTPLRWSDTATEWEDRYAIKASDDAFVTAEFSGAVENGVQTSRGASVLEVQNSEALSYFGVSEYAMPDDDCFACIALPIVWGFALIVFVIGLVIAKYCRQLKSLEAPPVISNRKKFLLHHIWTRCFLNSSIGFEQGPLHKGITVAFVVVFTWCLMAVFYENDTERYDWDVDMDLWPLWGVIGGLVATLTAACFEFSAVTTDTTNAVKIGLFAVKLMVLAGMTLLMYLHTSNYNTANQEERYVYSFIVALLSHILIFEALRCLIMYVSPRQAESWISQTFFFFLTRCDLG